MAEELDVDAIFKFKVDELKQELAKRGLIRSGSKSDLQERLLQYVTSQFNTKEYESEPTDTSVADTDEKLTNSLDTEDTEVADSVAECSGKHENSIDDIDNSDSTEVVCDNLINNVDETPNDTSVPDLEDCDEYTTVDQTDFIKHTCPEGVVVPDEHSNLEHTKSTSETKFCRVTITSPEITEGMKKENRSKRFGALLSESETERKKSRLGRFSSMGLGQGEVVTEEDIEKIKKKSRKIWCCLIYFNKSSQCL